MCPGKVSDYELLRSVYRHLDREALLRDCPDLTPEDVDNFFRRISVRVKPSDKPAPTPPAADMPALYTDGGSRGNPGLAGFGVVLLDAAGRVLAEDGGTIGQGTNNEAEYSGLIFGLEKAREAGLSEIVIRSDSLLLVQQINGRFKVKSRNLVPLFLRARKMLDEFRSWRAEHIPREQNARADQLANEAMDRGERS